MGDVVNAAELTNFFAVSISVIFGLWFERVETVIALKRPLAYAERKPYVRQLVSVLLARAIPLAGIMAAFVVVFAPTTLSALSTYSLGFGKDIDAGVTVFCLMYWFLLYIFFVSVHQVWQLAQKLRQSREGRPGSQPRVTRL